VFLALEREVESAFRALVLYSSLIKQNRNHLGLTGTFSAEYEGYRDSIENWPLIVPASC